MSDIVSGAVPAAIALVGTLITVAFGYYQWKRQHDASQRSGFTAEQRAAYTEIWQNVEQVHVAARTDDLDRAEFDELLRGVNAVILQRGLYLDQQDHVLINQYLEAVYRFTGLVRAYKDENLERQMRATASLVPDDATRGREIMDAVSAAEKLRTQLIERFRRVIA